MDEVLLPPVKAWPEIAIPSYQRPEILRDKTLRTLQRLQVPPDKITVFVATEYERQRYREALYRETYGQLKVGEPGMGAIRRHIQAYYEDGQKLVNIDDDIGAFYVKVHDKKYEELTPQGFQTMIELGFWSCEQAKCRLWGIYPVLNPLFMKKRVKVGLTYIVGAFWGVINTHDAALGVTLDDKEDFERTIKFYLADSAVIRLEAYSLRTSYYNTPGGMQVERTPERIDASARLLAERYPMVAKLNFKKASGHTEIRLVDPKRRKVLT